MVLEVRPVFLIRIAHGLIRIAILPALAHGREHGGIFPAA